MVSRSPFPRDESGFTLPELLVTMTMMLTVLFALYSIFDTSVRIFRHGKDELKAVEDARLGLERMEREIRAAYPRDDGTLISVAGERESGEFQSNRQMLARPQVSPENDQKPPTNRRTPRKP